MVGEREGKKSKAEGGRSSQLLRKVCVWGGGVGVGGGMSGENGLLMEKNLDREWPPCLS